MSEKELEDTVNFGKIENHEMSKLIKSCINRQRYDLLDKLLSMGFDLNSDTSLQKNPLAHAVMNNDYKAVLTLLQAGSDPRIILINELNYPKHINILGLSFAKADLSISQLLVAYGSDINYDNGIMSDTTLHTYLLTTDTVDHLVLKRMFENGLYIERMPYAFLHLYFYHLDLVVRDDYNQTLYDLNRESPYQIKKCVELLISNGVYTGEDQEQYDFSPLILSAFITTMLHVQEWDDITLFLLQNIRNLTDQERDVLPGVLIQTNKFKSFRFMVDNNIIDSGSKNLTYCNLDREVVYEKLEIWGLVCLIYKHAGRKNKDNKYEFVKIVATKLHPQFEDIYDEIGLNEKLDKSRRLFDIVIKNVDVNNIPTLGSIIFT